MNHPVKQENMQCLAAYRRELFKTPHLRFLFFELTDRCNLNCCHCGSRCNVANGNFLTVATVEKVLRSVLREHNPKEIMVCLTGGEPLLHPEFVEVIRLSHNLGFSVGITTNGTLIDEKKAYEMALAGLDTVTVSIDGTEEEHDTFRGVPGSFQRAMRGVYALRSAGFDPEALSVIHKGNFDRLEEIYAFMRKENFYFWRVVNVEPIGRAREKEELLLSPTQLSELFRFIQDKRFNPHCNMDISYGCSHFVGLDLEREVRDFYFQCGAGTMVASVMANGDIGACLDIERKPELIQGNIYWDDFADVWKNGFRAFRHDRSEQSKTCADCDCRGLCMGDSAHTWDYDSNEPGYCVYQMLKGN